MSSWTPLLKFGSASVGMVYARQIGRYTEVNGLVFVEAEILLSNKGSSLGPATITGLPFAQAVGLTGLLQVVVETPLGEVKIGHGRIDPSDSVVGLAKWNGDVFEPMLHSDFHDDQRVLLSGWYTKP